jgi:hypothetical protein
MAVECLVSYTWSSLIGGANQIVAMATELPLVRISIGLALPLLILGGFALSVGRGRPSIVFRRIGSLLRTPTRIGAVFILIAGMQLGASYLW